MLPLKKRHTSCFHFIRMKLESVISRMRAQEQASDLVQKQMNKKKKATIATSRPEYKLNQQPDKCQQVGLLEDQT